MFIMFHHYKTKHVIYIHLLCIKLHLSVYNDVTDTVNDVWPLKQNVGQYSYQKSRTSTYKDQTQTLLMPYRQEPPRFGY